MTDRSDAIPSLDADSDAGRRELSAAGPAALFVPADRSERVRKASVLADLLIVDLEDAVKPNHRQAARRALIDLAHELDPRRTLVRVNAATSDDFRLDMEALSATPLRMCLLAKTERVQHVEAAAPLLVVALCETPLGVLEASDIAEASNCVGLMWGSEDLAMDLGAFRSRSVGRLTPTMEWARQAVLLAAKARSRVAIDAVFPAIDDVTGLRSEAVAGANAGFDAKACIHPRQIAEIRAAFHPTDEQLLWAESVLAGSEAQGGLSKVNGDMVDAPVIRRAAHIITRARTARPD
jgi:citrate lyase subunit beta/citryl-CoA lyase